MSEPPLPHLSAKNKHVPRPLGLAVFFLVCFVAESTCVVILLLHHRGMNTSRGIKVAGLACFALMMLALALQSYSRWLQQKSEPDQ